MSEKVAEERGVTWTMATRKRTPLRPTAMEATAITAGPVRNLTAMEKAAMVFPHAMILGCKAMNKPVILQQKHTHTIYKLACFLFSLSLFFFLLPLKQLSSSPPPTHLNRIQHRAGRKVKEKEKWQSEEGGGWDSVFLIMKTKPPQHIIYH